MCSWVLMTCCNCVVLVLFWFCCVGLGLVDVLSSMFSMLVASCSDSLPEEYRIENVRRSLSNKVFMSSENVLGLCCVAVVSSVERKLSYS